MDKALKDMITHLRSSGYSSTTARIRVFEAMYGHPPMRMHELAKTCADIDRASVYRTIKLFETIGIVNRIYTGWKYQVELSEPYHAHHHHMHCIKCHSIMPLHDAALEMSIETTASSHDFQLSSHTIELHGICRTCQ